MFIKLVHDCRHVFQGMVQGCILRDLWWNWWGISNGCAGIRSSHVRMFQEKQALSLRCPELLPFFEIRNVMLCYVVILFLVVRRICSISRNTSVFCCLAKMEVSCYDSQWEHHSRTVYSEMVSWPMLNSSETRSSCKSRIPDESLVMIPCLL